MNRCLMNTDTITATIAGHEVQWMAVRAVTLSGEGLSLIASILAAHEFGDLVPVIQKPRPPSWCERLWMRWVLLTG